MAEASIFGSTLEPLLCEIILDPQIDQPLPFGGDSRELPLRLDGGCGFAAGFNA
jgi:hypothetical protein